MFLCDGEMKQNRAANGRPARKKNGSEDPPLQLWLRVGTALERGAIVVGAIRVVAIRLLFGLLGLAAKSGLAGPVV